MKLVVISTASFVRKSDGYYAYAPYIKEMELWAKHSGSISFACPVREDDGKSLLSKVNFDVSKVYRLREFDLLSLSGILRGILSMPINFFLLFRAMSHADHIHLRCPGNISLMGCIVQIFFPRKPKTAKYAGNWDPDSAQPLSYRWQRNILSNTFFTRNMSVLVYGKWEKSTKNIKPFFTASYFDADIENTPPRSLDGTIRFVFAGGLSENKRPLYAAQLVSRLIDSGIAASLNIFGEGVQRASIEEFIAVKKLSAIRLMGNCSADVVKRDYQQSHFLILPSKSEGWPKVVAEAMFWGCVPAASGVSCVPFMLDGGSRGLLLTMELEQDALSILEVIQNKEAFHRMAMSGMQWSREFTMDKFEEEISKLLQ